MVLKKYQVPGTVPSGKPPKSEPYRAVPCSGKAPKEGKSQRVITVRGGCSRSAVSKHIKCIVDWKEEIGKENVHKQQG